MELRPALINYELYNFFHLDLCGEKGSHFENQSFTFSTLSLNTFTVEKLCESGFEFYRLLNN